MLSGVAGRRITYRNPGIPAFLRHIRAAGHSLAFGLVMTGVYTAARLGLAAGITPDLERLLGHPATPFPVFAKDCAPLWRPAAMTAREASATG